MDENAKQIVASNLTLASVVADTGGMPSERLKQEIPGYNSSVERIYDLYKQFLARLESD